jgi:hypothetical protein
MRGVLRAFVVLQVLLVALRLCGRRKGAGRAQQYRERRQPLSPELRGPEQVPRRDREHEARPRRLRTGSLKARRTIARILRYSPTSQSG